MIQNQFYWIRILKKYNAYFETSKESWKKSIFKMPTEFIRKLAMAALHFFETASQDIEDNTKVDFYPWNEGVFYQQLTPLHIAAYDGDLNFFYEVKKVTLDLNQCLKQSRIAPIHLAAYRGHITLCRQLLHEWDANNIPYGKYEAGGLHYAAVAGHFEVYELFHGVQEMKNPGWAETGKTHLHIAAQKGHTEICKCIIEKTKGRIENTQPADGL
jgi:hypothetical protein